jgi:putative flippase GtrA
LEPVRLSTGSGNQIGYDMKQLLREFSGYGVASVAALSVDMALLWALVHVGIQYLAAAAVSFTAGAVVAYWLSTTLAFRQHRMQDRRVEFLGFVAIGVAGLTINTSVIYAAVQFLGLHYMLAKSAAAGFTFTFNFIVRRQILFVAPALS